MAPFRFSRGDKYLQAVRGCSLRLSEDIQALPLRRISVQLLTSVQTFSRFSAEPNNLLIWIRFLWGTHLEFCRAVGKCPVRCSPWSHLKDKHPGAVSLTRSMELCGALVGAERAGVRFYVLLCHLRAVGCYGALVNGIVKLSR